MTAADLDKALALKENNSDQAIDLLAQIVKKDLNSSDEEEVRLKEKAITELGDLFAKKGKADELWQMIKFTRPFLELVSKAKAAKLVRNLVDQFLDMEAATGKEIDLCKECIDWSKQENRTFLRQALEARLISLYFDNEKYQEALVLGSNLLKELKKLDDKVLLVEVQLLESKTYHALSNLPKARAALTSARTTANGIYCHPKLQAALDTQSGILHAADERDFKTGYSYFYEAFEGYDSIDSPKAVSALKYMLLSKIMLHCSDEVNQIITGKLALKYNGSHIEAMKSIAQASHKRSLADFNHTLSKYQKELKEDPIVSAHLDSLYDSLLEQNLCRIIEPFSKVQVQHVAKLIDLNTDVVEKKLSQMILDDKLKGILDQGAGVLVLFEGKEGDKSYKVVIESVHHLGKVVEGLFSKAVKLT